MNKIFKKVVASLLTIAALTTVGPAKYTSLLTTTAHASDTKSDKAVLKDLDVERNGSSTKLYKDDDFKRKTSFESDRKKYYVDLGSKNKISIDAEVSSDYEIKLFKDSDKDSDEEKFNTDIKVKKNKTKFYINVYEKGKTEVLNKYTIYAYKDKDRDKDDDDDDDDEYDDVYLETLKVDSKKIDLKKSKTTYKVDVDEDKTSVKITAEPDDKDYEVRINGSTVDDDDDFKEKVSLKKGKNEIEIRVRDDDKNKRVYTLIINRESSSEEKEDNKDNTNVAARPNQWVIVNENLMYNDVLGNPIKNNWFIDRNTGAWHYFDANGYMKKGWFISNGNWYYLNEYSGQMQSGWSYINGQRYYLNPYSDGTRGAMKTGWINDNGIWYYLNPQSGEMKTGWINDNGIWYYCDWLGQMLKNTTVGGYRLGSTGAWIR
ncbi:cadherin-like beta sandwich domain-containing protein [Clostridium sp. ZBS15]|uniref:N-acetylmuramoyl-L-alanine amidase family protein n=1 Tax=Clostridium sp. ZBS15 TaxID=2949969 RepID=UPI00207993F0|nr:cadherin-like beta sandwich domain-containing protein [Clostridium sp. ZBS15]